MEERGDAVPAAARRGRGATTNRDGRFETQRRFRTDDGWEGSDDGPPPLRTEVGIDATRTVITRNQSPDVPFDRSINPYRGCEHGCVYCFARPSHAYLGLSPGLDFESRLLAKPEAPELLARELARPGYRCEVIAMGTNTDPYQPVERKYRVTRRLLEVLEAHRHPVSLVTKSHRVTEDVDVLARLAARRLTKVMVSVTTLDRKLARRMEPRASAPARRLDAIRALSAAGVPVGVLVAPVVPGLTDHELEAILAACAAAGAGEAGYLVLRLPGEVAGLWRGWLAEHYPDRAGRVMARIAGLRGGRDNDPRFGPRMRGTGPDADLLARRFEVARRRLGYAETPLDLDTGLFRPPTAQLALL